jgi:hypothetical protein
VPLKSTEHRNTGTGPEEVEEEPMAMARAARKPAVQAEVFLVPYYSCSQIGERQLRQNNSSLFFLFFLLKNRSVVQRGN